MYVVVRKLM
ncbi:uncharacterized protein FTOL_06489 [Fusarium torulosum]|uniref:Uncharacterized protein n=1 Tax=Fusarium torulosum TaxID=33205 RepID=A0AAE8SIG6_9HYPO|nr:uncharacterized protein FTOL_06489 [Fusarium torulosum]